MSDSNIIRIKIGNAPIKNRCSTVIGGVEITADTEKELDTKIHEHRMRTIEDYKTQYLTEMEVPLNIEKIKTSNYHVTICSMVGVGGTAPYGYGNYFSMMIDGKEYAIINMWEENLEDALERFGLKELEFDIIEGHMASVTSKEIDPKWKMKPFLKYNLRKGISTATRHKIFEHYKED